MVTIEVNRLLSDSALYKHKYLDNIKNYTNLQVNLMVNSNINSILKQPCYPILQGLHKTFQWNW